MTETTLDAVRPATGNEFQQFIGGTWVPPSSGAILSTVVQGDTVPYNLVPRLIELHRADRDPFDKMVTFYPFDKINEVFADAESGRTLKPVVR